MALDVPRIAVFGSSSISVPVFDAIRCRFHVVLAVVSEEPRIRRGKLLANPVQAWAESHSIPVLNGAETPEGLLTKQLVDGAVDILFLLSYGRLLPQALLDAPRLASINLHPSPLPWYRGAAPIERQIMDGCRQSAVSIIRMNGLLDRGELLAQESFTIADSDYRTDVEASIIRVGVPLTLHVFDQLLHSSTTPLQQTGAGSYARKLKSDDELIDWSGSIEQAYNLVRALAPEPCACSFQETDRLKILRAIPLSADIDLSADAPSGTVAQFLRKRVAVRCGDGWLELLELQFPGKTPMSTVDLLNGRRLVPGNVLRRNPFA
ncbi:methionyl-tRNA formyltransferase [Candidatus Cryosericum septentrionale]|jgi:methionyl-tRNA formyltransferase|uniref:methionyl-tRNA formyltransferase n=1 Tax=Candidatus Cryosericum septentrionale TaxID=2290913 RepID=A0A398DX92_9BACT|nr:methionyl-tRNA formyltransferase [Candidatus Cryosericum septentrionale]RIE16758.1 methionyl-tRNA formyltransferase [Candidatus Cryosericum septentrionale]